MYVETVPNRESRPAILLREGWREGQQVRKHTIANLTSWPPAKVALLRRVLRDEPLAAPDDAFAVERSLPHGHVEVVLEAMRRLGLPALLDRRRSPRRARALALVAERVLRPASKLATARLLDDSTLAAELGLGAVDADDLYEAMDWLAERQERIERRLAKRHLAEGGQALYDVSSSYYEGRTCPLARFGHSRDGKRGRPVVVYGLLADAEGRPVAVRAHPGDTADPNTLPGGVERLRGAFGLRRVVLVGDRGMLTDARIDDLRRHPGLGWVSALRHHAIRKLAEGGAFQPSLFDERGLAEIASDDYPGERLVVCRNPLLAERRQRKREELLAAAEAGFQRIAREVARRTRTPLGAAAIAEKAARVKSRFKVGKHFDTDIADGAFSWSRRQADIDREAAVDGFHIVRTDQDAESLSAEDAVRSYKNLARVERAFRCLKTVDLRVRPIHHRAEKRVRAHLFLCILAYYVEWHLRKALAPLLFQDENLDDAVAARDPVAAASPGEAVRRKKARGATADGLPLRSFSTLLAHLATRCRNRCRAKGVPDAPAFDCDTEPSPVQTRALELVRTFPVDFTL